MTKIRLKISNFLIDNRVKIILFIVAPLVVWGILFLGYTFGPDWARNIISPDRNREFGLLENLQSLILLISFLLVFKTWQGSEERGKKWAFLVCMCVIGFLFLEEIDYGQLYFRYFTNISFKFTILDQKFRAFHNLRPQGGRELGHTLFVPIGKYFKIGFFIIAPLLLWWSKNRFIRKILPSLWFTALASISFVCHKIVFIYRGEMEGSLRNNYAEFNELFIYYLVLLYLYQVTSSRVSAIEKP